MDMPEIRTTEETFAVLPLEIRSNIYNFCMKDDLKSLTQCCKWLRQDVLPSLWKKMIIQWKDIEKSTPALCTEENGNMKFISELEFSGVVAKKSQGYLSFGFAYFLQSCNSDNLKSLSIGKFIAQCGLRLVSELFPNLNSLKLAEVKADVKADWESLPLFSSLKKLIIHDCSGWSEAGKDICNMSQLEVLEISYDGTDGMDRFFDRPHDFKLINLVDLNLYYTRVSDQQLSIISTTCVKLEGLTVAGGEFTDLGISFISHLSSLRRLHVEETGEVTDGSLLYISQIPKLHHLALQTCYCLTPCCIKQIVTIKTLTYLDLCWSLSGTTDEDFASITYLKSLRTLDICGMENLTNASFEVISQLSNLQQLDITSCHGFTDDGLSYLTKLVHLKALICDVHQDGDEDDEDDDFLPYPITMVGINAHNLSHLLVESF